MEWGLRTTEPIFHSYRQSTLGGFTRILFFTFGRTAGCFCLSHCVNFCEPFFFFFTKPQIEGKDPDYLEALNVISLGYSMSKKNNKRSIMTFRHQLKIHWMQI